MTLYAIVLSLVCTAIQASDAGAAVFSQNPVDISNQLERDSRDREGGLLVPVADLLQNWDSFKDGLDRRYGLQFEIDYQALYQSASSSPGDSEAASGWLGLFGIWKLTGRGTEHPGRLGFKVENRHRLGTDLVPAALGRTTGSAWSTAGGWGKFDLSVVELWWEQHLVRDHFAFRAGKVLPFALYDYSRFKNPKTGFLNQMFNINPALPFPSFGLGAAVLARPRTDIYFVAGIHDANGQPTTAGFDTFFEDKEYFTAAEIGWDPGNIGVERPDFFNNADYHITLWHIDARERTGTSSGQGFTLSAEQPVSADTTLFARYGYADGSASAVKQMAAAGIGFGNIFGNKNDLITIGTGWGRNREDLDQYALEAFYRIQITPRLTITPDIQLILDPVANPDREIPLPI
jgi:porin